MSEICKDIELCQHIISMIEAERINGFSPTVMSKNLFSSNEARNTMVALGIDKLPRVGIESLIEIKNILEVIDGT